MKNWIGPSTLQTLILLCFIWMTGPDRVHGQVFSDNFNTITSATWTTSGQIGISPWSVFRSGDDWGARRNTSPAQLECTNDVSGAAQANGFVMVSVPTTAFGSPYSTTLSANTGVITWTFNMRQIRTDPGGFATGAYGVAFILAGQTASDNITGSGYAVVLGQSGTTDSIRLVSYVTGPNGDAGLTNIIKSNTTGLTDIGAEYLSIKVTYNPCNNNTWQLFVRNDGVTAFADPLIGTLTLQGTATNSTYTGIPLDMMAAYWQGSTGASQTAFFDNVTVSILSPSVVLGPNPKPCFGSTMTTLLYSGAAGSPNQYSIDWDGAANSAGFTDITNVTLPVSPIPITIPGGAAVGTYHAVLTVRNSTTLCSSVGYPFNVQIKSCTPPLPSTMEWVLLPNGEGIGACVSSSDCTNDVLCYGLEYTPLYTGTMTTYTTGFFIGCMSGINPVLSNSACLLHDNSQIHDFCTQAGVVLFNSSTDQGVAVPVFKGVPQIIHQVCYSIPSSGTLTVTRDNLPGALSTSIDSTSGGGFESDTIAHYIALTIDSSLACSALPLKWLSFNATRYDDLMSKLDWSTTDEINVSHFEVQRSNDGGRNFYTIGTASASIRNEAVHNYQFIDRHAESGKNFYRIRQVDFDQRSDVSPIRTVSFTGKNSFSVNAWPNPVSDMLTIDIHDAAEALHMTIVDISGRIVWKGTSDSGSSAQLIDVASFGAGMYSLVVEGNTVRDIQKIVVIR
ncbi:MAG: T9SS type A sorting domain-containing protein [Saprospiraceae bacterium]|uniref:T9SS type A sorting domain-containing protein n=1 Tax=Candidatus Opimibacter skivensis TaxID=2982028 RepID=A0A9D7SUQ3_9BACT|nr:T9SS type A sorting domain-containing protein [Candidatus Opimibacter skivensis]